MPPPGQQNNNLSYWQKVENAQWWMMYPALTVMVFIRRDMGYRFLNPKHLLSVTGPLAIFSALVGPTHPGTNPQDLFWFAVLSLSLGLAQRGKRWKELKAGSVQHSYYIGSSPFDYRWLPDWCRRDRRMARIFDPIFCAGIGVWVFPSSSVLSYWLMFAAVSLRGYEHAVYRKELNRDMDIIDSLIISQVHSKTVEHFEGPPQSQPQQPSAGIPTGLAPDIQEQIKRRKSQ